MPNDDSAADDFARRIEAVEVSYEAMLAYAAQGRDSDLDPAEVSGIRQSLEELDAAIAGLADAARESVVRRAPGPIESYGGMLDVFAEDCAKARAGLHLVLGQPTISSQAVDNLNAFTHLRAMLTDIFLIDETLGEGG